VTSTATDGSAVTRSARTVILLAIIGQFVAFLRTAIIAASFGASHVVDSYYLGTVAPSFVATVFGGCLQVSFLGRYAALLAKGDADLANAYRSRMLALVVAVSMSVTLLCVWWPDVILGVFLPANEDASALGGAVALSGIAYSLVPMICADFLGLILNAHGRFFAAALAPVCNAVVSVAGLAIWPTIDMPALVWTLVLGSCAQLLVIGIAVWHAGLFFSLRSSLARSEVWTTMAISLPILPAIMLSNSANAILQFRTAELGEGGIAVLNYALKLHFAISQILVVGFGTVLLPHFASLWALGRHQEIATMLRRLSRYGIVVCAFLFFGVATLGVQAVSVLLRRGQFNDVLSVHVADIWLVLTLSVFPFALGTFIAKLAQAARRSILILMSSALSFCVTWVFATVGARTGSLTTVAMSFAAAFMMTTIFWLAWLVRVNPTAKIIIPETAKALLIALLMIAPLAVLDVYLKRLTSDWPVFVDLVARGTIYSLLFGSMAYALQARTKFFSISDAPEYG
jgi:putative peptidoglycan lipid II flippase